MSVADGDVNESDFTIYTSTSTCTTTPEWSEPCRRFKFHEIVSATGNFKKSLVIGRGGFGYVYKGNIVNASSRVDAAIKRRYPQSKQWASEFRAEVEILSRVRHTHLVPLIGYCDDGEEMILVYEYIPNGTLDEHLHSVRTRLSWLQRLKICVGVARGIDYLHTGMGIGFIIHRDVKTSNILLNKSCAAKMTDFGFSKIVPQDQQSTSYVSTAVKGTVGYIDPAYFSTGRLTGNSDVYSFGVVLFEVLCRKGTFYTSLDGMKESLVRWAKNSIKD